MKNFNNNTPRKLSLKQRLSIIGTSPILWFAIPFILLPSVIIFSSNLWGLKKSVNFPEGSPERIGILSDIKDVRYSIDNYTTYNYYFYYIQNNDTLDGISYSLKKQYEIGDSVTLVYLADNPQKIAIKGMSTIDLRSGGKYASTIFLAIGFVLLIAGLIHGASFLKYVIHGKLAVGTYRQTKEEMPHKGTRMFKVIYQFKTEEGKKGLAMRKTSKPKYKEEENRTLVYLDKDLKNAKILDRTVFPNICKNILLKF